jgi:aminoglycoside 3-N-acetyltransferase
MIIKKSDLISDLLPIKNLIGSTSSFILHSDILKVGIIDKFKKGDASCEDYFNVLSSEFSNNTILIPTFNYDFPLSRVMNVRSTPCQVGALGNYVIKITPNMRTLTPIFSFGIKPGNDQFSMEASGNPFGEASTFAEITNKDGYLFFFGMRFSECNTYTHYIEERLNIGYRYIKRFQGSIVDNEYSELINFDFRVRPISGIVSYDWERLERDAFDQNILHEFRLGNGIGHIVKVLELLAFWTRKIKEDEFYLLTAESRSLVLAESIRVGYPFLIENLEP